MINAMRRIYAGATWLFFAAVIVQFFLAGLGVFVNSNDFAIHAIFGGIILLLGLLTLILAFAARLPWRRTGLTALLPLLVIVQSLLIEAGKSGAHLVSAFHVLNALLVFIVSGYVARQARSLFAAQPRTTENQQARRESPARMAS